MLIRLRRILGFVLAAAIGFVLANGFVANFFSDVTHMGIVALGAYRARSGSGSTLWILVAGILLGQAGVLTTRRVIARLAVKSREWDELTASWDAGLHLPTRFGMQRYLDACVSWAAQGTTESAQSVVLFKLSGIGALNEKRGSRVATELFHEIARELRISTLPSNSSRFSFVLARHWPRRFNLDEGKTPVARCAARWTGSTFALAFRGLEVHHAFAVVRELTTWLRSELATAGADSGLELKVAFVMAPFGTSARSIVNAAGVVLAVADVFGITVGVDPNDGRASLLAAVPDLRRVDVAMDHPDSSVQAMPKQPARSRLGAWVRGWGPIGVCLAGVPAIMAIGAGKSDLERQAPWAPDITSVPVRDGLGSSETKLVRHHLTEETSSDWKLSAGKLTQGDPNSQTVRQVEVYLEVTNLSKFRRYVSFYDFSAVDADGNELEFPSRRVMKLDKPLDGRWLARGEKLSGWMSVWRGEKPVTAIVFRPFGSAHMLARAVD